MTRESNGVRRLIEDLSMAALKDLLRNVRHHSELQRRIVAGDTTEREVNAAYFAYARRQGPDYRREVADLTIRYYGDLVELGNRYSEDFYKQFLDGHLEPVTDEPEDDGSAERIAMELHGPPGKEVVGTFTVENTDDTPADVAFVPGECRGPEDQPFIAPISFQPSRATLAPNERREVIIRLAMLPSLFVPGHLYSLPVRVAGNRELVLALSIWAEEPMHVAPPAAAPEPARQASPRRTPTDHAVLCVECGRTFSRTEPSTRLYPHNTPAGAKCPAREGTAV